MMMNKNYESQLIQNEIRELLSQADAFLTKKDEILMNMKKVYLNSSNCN